MYTIYRHSYICIGGGWEGWEGKSAQQRVDVSAVVRGNERGEKSYVAAILCCAPRANLPARISGWGIRKLYTSRE